MQTGTPLADMTIPEEVSLWEVREDYILKSAPDGNGIYGVVMYRLQRETK